MAAVEYCKVWFGSTSVAVKPLTVNGVPAVIAIELPGAVYACPFCSHAGGVLLVKVLLTVTRIGWESSVPSFAL